MKTYKVEVIRYEGKNKVTDTEMVRADHYEKDGNNNAVFYDENFEFIIEYHCYNHIRIWDVAKEHLLLNAGS
jgi:hypothetical protein